MNFPPLTTIFTALALTAGPSFGQTVNETHKLFPSDASAGDYFGHSVAVSGTTGIVGAWFDDDNGSNSGSAYLFDTSTGAEISKLLASDGAANDYFGDSVAISGTTVIVGAPSDDDNGDNSGSAYLFDISDPTAPVELKLLPLDGSVSDRFGLSVAISGTTAIVGSLYDDDNGSNSGSAYLFDIMTGVQLAKLLPGDGAAGDMFGNSVSISGTMAIVGVSKDDDKGDASGSAYLFDTATGVELAKLTASDGAEKDGFGVAVGVSGFTAIVGSGGDDDNGDSSGSAYLFDISDPAAPEEFKLLPVDGEEGDRFGVSVAVSETMAVVGAYSDDVLDHINAGSAYIFDFSDPAAVAEMKLLPSDGATVNMFGHFGFSVGISGTTAISGASIDDDNGWNAGSAYLFDVPLDPGTSFCFGDGTGTPCPCGNFGGPSEGCANITFSGAQLSGSGSSSIAADDLVLTATGLVPNQPGLFFMGDTALNGGNGVPFGSGLRCIGGDVWRLQIVFSNSNGVATTTTSISSDQYDEECEGLTTYFQYWYRDPFNACGVDFNFTNAYELTWTL